MSRRHRGSSWPSRPTSCPSSFQVSIYVYVKDGVASSYLDKTTDEAQRKTVAQDRLNKDTQSKDVNPGHDSITVASATETESLTPDTTLVLLKLLLLTLLCLTSTLVELPLTRCPASFAHLVDELSTVLLENRDSEQAELVILGQFN